MKTLRTITSVVYFGAVVAFGLLPARAADSDEEDIRFKQGEFDFSPFGVYSDQAGGKWGAGVAATYFIFDKLGVGAATYWTELGGTVFDNIEFEGYFRIPVFKVVAPYAVASLGYQFDHDYWFETIGGGVDFRPFKNITAFSDAQWRIANSSAENGPIVRLGVRLSF